MWMKRSETVGWLLRKTPQVVASQIRSRRSTKREPRVSHARSCRLTRWIFPRGRFEACHTAGPADGPDGAVGGLAQPSNVVASQAVLLRPGGWPRLPIQARQAAGSPDPEGAFPVPPDAPDHIRRQALRHGPGFPLALCRAIGRSPRRSDQSTRSPRDLPARRWSWRWANPVGGPPRSSPRRSGSPAPGQWEPSPIHPW